MLIGLMFLKNPVVYIQFHPVTYMVKLNIEMSMASLVVRLARGKTDNDMFDFDNSSSNHRSKRHSLQHKNRAPPDQFHSFHLSSATRNKGHSKEDSDDTFEGIHCRTDVHVISEQSKDVALDVGRGGSSRSSAELTQSPFEDDAPLNKNGVKITEMAV